MKNMSETSYSNLLLSSHVIISVLEKTVYKQIEKKKKYICNTLLFEFFSKINLQVTSKYMKHKYSQNVTCVCKNILSVKHILLECPITTELFQKNGYDFNACNNVRYFV